MTEELTDKEREELEALKIEIMTPAAGQEGEDSSGENASGESPEGEGGEGTAGAEPGTEGEGEGEGSKPRQEPWKDFPIDPETGYAKDPDTGAYVDPETGAVLGGSYEGGIDPNASPAPTISPQGEASPSSSPEAFPSQMPQTGE